MIPADKPRLAWAATLDGPESGMDQADPVVAESAGLVLVPAEAGLSAYVLATGELRWRRTDLRGPIAPCDDATIAAASESGTEEVRVSDGGALRTSTEPAELLRSDGAGGIIASWWAMTPGLSATARLVWWRFGDAQPLWRIEPPTLGSADAIAIREGTVVAVVDSGMEMGERTTRLEARHLGKPLWAVPGQQILSEAFLEWGALAGETLFTIEGNGTMFDELVARSATDGAVRWRQREEGVRLAAPPLAAVSGAVVAVLTVKGLRVFRGADGAPAGEHPALDDAWLLAIDERRLLYRNKERLVCAITASPAETVWSLELPHAAVEADHVTLARGAVIYRDAAEVRVFTS